MADYLDIKPELLRWAVDRSGKPAEEYRERVVDWLSGEAKPTLRQLEAFARRAMVPFGYLFLEEPPAEELPTPDYRTRTDDRVRQPSPNLIETIFEMQRRQDWMREYLLDEGQDSRSFVGSAREGDDVAPLARRIREGLELEEDWAERQPNYGEALRRLREAVEAAGILIFINGIVGNDTHRRLDPDEFQGFVLIDSMAPLVFINGSDYKSAQMFTIAHELAHVWLGSSALFDLVATEPSNVEVETYCNSVAAEFLVPEAKLSQVWGSAPDGDDAFLALAKRFKVSPIVVARRAKDLRLMTTDQFFAFYRRYRESEEGRSAERPSGGNFWNTQNTRVGRRFGRAVVTAALDGRLSYSDAYALTRLYGSTFDAYANLLFQKVD